MCVCGLFVLIHRSTHGEFDLSFKTARGDMYTVYSRLILRKEILQILLYAKILAAKMFRHLLYVIILNWN